MQNIIVRLTSDYGGIAIFFLIALENIFPPIPSEVILTFSGFATTYTKLNFFSVLLFSTLGSMFGAIVLYLLGNYLDSTKLKKLVKSKLGLILHLKVENIDKANDWFLNKGNKTVLFCRFIPVVRSLISIPAGMSKMRLTKFFIYTLIGTLIWNSTLISLGIVMGSNWNKISDFISNFSNYFLVFILLIIFIFIIKKMKRKNS